MVKAPAAEGNHQRVWLEKGMCLDIREVSIGQGRTKIKSGLRQRKLLNS